MSGKVKGIEMLKFGARLMLLMGALLSLSACSSLEVYSSEPLPESKIYFVEGIDNPIIQFIWLEMPALIQPGEADVRLFLARTDPPECSIPNLNDIRCNLSSDDAYVLLGPERVPFEFKEDSSFSGSYTYRACPECIECYMNWDYTLEMTGVVSQEGVQMEIAVKHFGLNVQGSFVSAELELVDGTAKEPRIACNRLIECRKIKFEKID